MPLSADFNGFVDIAAPRRLMIRTESAVAAA